MTQEQLLELNELKKDIDNLSKLYNDIIEIHQNPHNNFRIDMGGCLYTQQQNTLIVRAYLGSNWKEPDKNTYPNLNKFLHLHHGETLAKLKYALESDLEQLKNKFEQTEIKNF